MLHTKFRGNRSTGFGGHVGHLGHVINIILSNFHFIVPKGLHTKVVKNGPVVSEKSKF